MPDSQAGQIRGFELRRFLDSKDEQCDSSCQRKCTEDWRNGNSVMLFRCGLLRSGILLLAVYSKDDQTHGVVPKVSQETLERDDRR